MLECVDTLPCEKPNIGEHSNFRVVHNSCRVPVSNLWQTWTDLHRVIHRPIRKKICNVSC